MKCLAIGMNPNYVLSEEERKKRFRKKNHSGNSEPDSNLVTDVDFKNISNNFKQGKKLNFICNSMNFSKSWKITLSFIHIYSSWLT